MKKKFTYKIKKWGVDYDGWYKCWVIRSDGKEVKLSHRRYHQLLREGRMEGERIE